MRLVVLALLASISVLVAPARAADVIAPGGAEPTGQLAACADPPAAPWCGFVQMQWYPTADRSAGAPGALPLAFDGVLTRIRMPFYAPAGRLAVKVARGVDGSGGASLDVVADSGAIAVDSTRVDAPLRLPIAKNQVIVLALTPDAQAYEVYEAGAGRPGDGYVTYARDATGSRLETERYGSTTTDPDGLSFAVTLEPDADRDGFGDESQDRCPGAAGPRDGCGAGPAPAPAAEAPASAPAPSAAPSPAAAAVRGLRVRGRTVRYTITRRARVVLRVQARKGGVWRTVRKARGRGRVGTQRLRLRGLRPGRRVVLTATAGGATTRLVATRPR